LGVRQVELGNFLRLVSQQRRAASSAPRPHTLRSRNYTGNIKVRDIIKRIEADGWREVSHEGSHRQYKHPLKKGRVTVAGSEAPIGTMKKIFNQAQIQEK
jgi:predicted RNA binding protein YcfA (HicA-like mRNA interferase family)